MTTADDFAAWPFSRIASVPRPPISEDPAQQRSQLFPAAVDSHASGRPFVVVWLRPVPGSPVEVFISSPGPAPGDGDGPLLYPPGSRGRPVAGSELVAKLGSLPAWIPCLGSADQLATEQQGPARAAPGTFEDYVSYLHQEAFAWAVIGRPRRPAALVDDLRRLRLEIPALRDASGNSEQARLECERAEARYRELSGARASGSWDISVLAAALDHARARRVASLLCSASDLVGLPYVLLPAADDAAAFADVLERVASSEDGACSPFLGTTAALVALAHPPETELPGVRVATSPAFDVTPEVWEPSPTVPDGIPRSQDGAIVIGSVLDHDLRPSSDLQLSHASLNRHTFVCGATGSGKSQTVRTLLEGLSGAGVPWLVIEPAKAEYALGMAGRLGLGNVVVIRPGDPSLIASGLNPLEPAQGFPLQSHVDLVRALFMAAFQAEEPFPQILSQALTRCYDDCGWDLVSGQPRVEWAANGISPRFPSLTQLQATAGAVVTDIGYSDKVASDMRGYVDVRIGSLRSGSPGRFFEGGHPLDVAQLLKQNVVLEIENISNDEDKAFVIGTVLVRLVEHLRVRTRNDGAPTSDTPLLHVTVVEEAHRLLRNVEGGRVSSHAVELFAALLAEIRAYGEGIVVAEQIPSKLLPDVIKNTACKFVHRLPAADDRAAVGATMNLTVEQSEYVVSLRPGTAAVFTDGMDRPVLAVLPDRSAREVGTLPEVRPPLVERAIGLCPAECDDRPCTLGDMGDAESVLRRHPRLELWVDVLAYNHIAGWPAMPRPQASWRRELLQSVPDQRLLACAVARAARRSADARQRWLVDAYQPDGLAGHLADVAGRVLAGQPSGCAVAKCARWQAGRERWADVIRALNGVEDKTVAHDSTTEWFGRGLDVRSLPAKSQLALVTQHPSRYFAHQTELELGGRPSRMGQLLARTALPGPTEQVVTSGLKFFEKPVDWTIRRMVPQLAREANGRPSAATGVGT